MRQTYSQGFFHEQIGSKILLSVFVISLSSTALAKSVKVIELGHRLPDRQFQIDQHQARFMGFSMPRLYAIIDPAQTGERSPLAVSKILLSAGVQLIQYRSKRGSSREVYENCRQISEWVRQAGGIFIVNDRADIARAVEASGVHVGQEDLPVELARRVVGRDKCVGCSTHLLAQVQQADRSSADYIAFGPVFATQSKERPDPLVGLEGLREVRQATRKPLVAIGGITLENARAAIQAGADSVAVIQDLMGAADIGARAKEFLRVLEES